MSGHWWCPRCESSVESHSVTHDEFHEHCGEKVGWIEEADNSSGLAVPVVSLRDFFAAAALPACYAQIIASCESLGYPENWRDGIAADALKMADAMLAARTKVDRPKTDAESAAEASGRG